MRSNSSTHIFVEVANYVLSNPGCSMTYTVSSSSSFTMTVDGSDSSKIRAQMDDQFPAVGHIQTFTQAYTITATLNDGTVYTYASSF